MVSGTAGSWPRISPVGLTIALCVDVDVGPARLERRQRGAAHVRCPAGTAPAWAAERYRNAPGSATRADVNVGGQRTTGEAAECQAPGKHRSCVRLRGRRGEHSRGTPDVPLRLRHLLPSVEGGSDRRHRAQLSPDLACPVCRRVHVHVGAAALDRAQNRRVDGRIAGRPALAGAAERNGDGPCHAACGRVDVSRGRGTAQAAES